jgi:CubicO group peptidase (beta-lactamase class C family)
VKLDFKGAGMNAARLDRIRPFLDRYVEEGRLPCWQVAVHRHGQPVWRGQGGLMDVERGRPVADDTIFRIYSMTKPVTSVALMTLFEQGRFQLDDPVARVFPEWAEGHRVWTGGSGEAMRFEPARRPISYR